MLSKKKKKVRLGKKTEGGGYEYKATVNFGENISSQISEILKERELNEIIRRKVKKLKEVTKKYNNKEKSLLYYYEIGRKLSFMDSEEFKNVAITSVLRRLAEELSDIIPMIENTDLAIRHLRFMYWIGHLEKKTLLQASWEQWFEITKFKKLYKKQKLLKLILKECRAGTVGHETLNKKIKELIENKS